MDCPSEENLIRMKLQDYQEIRQLDFDLSNRSLTIYHTDGVNDISNSLDELQLNSALISSLETTRTDFEEGSSQRNLLLSVLGINFLFFLIEMIFGFVSKSMGLVADSLDMLADSFVYGISLLAIGGTVLKKKKIATIAGYFQIVLAVIGFVEVIRRFVTVDRLPDFKTMIFVSFLALLANAICLYLLQKSKSKEDAHMKASMIFTSNDVIINVGVIVAALAVNYFHSAIPDLIIGFIVFLLVIQGAVRILKLGK